MPHKLVEEALLTLSSHWPENGGSDNGGDGGCGGSGYNLVSLTHNNSIR